MRNVLLSLLLCFAAPGRAELPVVELGAGMHLIRAEVAADAASRTQGLMFRKSMPQSSGMVFVFEAETQHCMWMKNTLIPLSVAFLDKSGTIVSVHDMQPHSEQSHCAAAPARYALEMNKGWFAQRGIKAGAKLRGLEKLQPR